MSTKNEKAVAGSPYVTGKVIDIMGRSWLWFLISGLVVVPGMIAIALCWAKFGAPVKPGIDFTGGSYLQYHYERKVSLTDVRGAMAADHLAAEVQSAGNDTYIIRTVPLDKDQLKALNSVMVSKLGNFRTDSMESVGPTIGAELLRNAMLALIIGVVGIIAYISFRYQLDFALAAIVALLHDVLVMVGTFAWLSLIFGAEADSLFVTALLTIMGFSVHDTIVIFDRFRENLRYAGKGDTFADVANRSVNQTFARSINTSLTVALTLLPLVVIPKIMGVNNIFYFTLIMLVGVISGTYSSIFNASPILVLWRDRAKRKQQAATARA